VPSTHTVHGAREDARARGAGSSPTQPTIPARLATDLPRGVAPASVVWDDTLGCGHSASMTLARATRVRLTDLEGDACVSVCLFNADQPSERHCVADTLKVQWQAYPGQGTLLLSDLGRVLVTVVDDTSRRHDAVCGPSPLARERLVVTAAKHGLGPRDVHPTITFFKGIRIAADGSIRWEGDTGPAGGHVELRTEMPVLLVAANAPHPLDERDGRPCSPVRITAWRDQPPSPSDPFRNASPEARRAFEQTEQYLTARGIA